MTAWDDHAMADNDTTAPVEEWEGASAPFDGDSIAAQMHNDDGDDVIIHEREPDDGDYFEEEEQQWKSLGLALTIARQRLGLSKREAARRAGLSDGAWRHLEAGSKDVYGRTVLPNPRPENLVSAAQAVGMRPEKAFLIVGRQAPGVGIDPATEDELAAEIRKLGEADRHLVEQLIYRLSRPF